MPSAADAHPGGDINRLLATIRDEAARRATRSPDLWRAAGEAEVPALPEPQAASAMAPGSLDALPREAAPPGQTIDYRPLLRYGNRRFVEQAFMAILGRMPETEALQSYTRYLDAGGSERSVMAELLLSSEGQQAGTTMTGMAWPKLRHRVLSRLGYPGRLLRRLFDALDRRALARQRPGLRLDDVVERLDIIEERRRQAETAHAQYLHELVDMLDARLEGIDRQAGENTALLQNLMLENNRLNEELRRLALIMTSQEESLGGQMHSLRTELTTKTETRVSELEEDAARLRRQTASAQQNLSLVTDQLRDAIADADQPTQLADEQLQKVAAVAETHADDAMDAYYVAFEEASRGSRHHVKDGLRHYLPYFERLQGLQKLRESTVIDVGCGRGEWLELLAGQDWTVQGIDLNPVMVEVCAEYGIDAVKGDAIAFLREQADDSLAAVTGFHIIEHLPFEILLQLVNEAMRVIRPGGLVLFETPNPENILVGSHTFYHDFTHRNPVTPHAAQFLLRYAGFSDIEVIRSHPYPESARVPGNDPLTERINGALCGPQDYAVLACKPLIDASGRLVTG
jgi:O-antigen chain-terminating methyltransferase